MGIPAPYPTSIIVFFRIVTGGIRRPLQIFLAKIRSYFYILSMKR